jgi:hypothetical protein
MISKRFAALFYDRQAKLFEELRAYATTTLGLPEDEKHTLARIILLCDALAAF